ncbi:MAG TPA: ABC transporter ATP-binding protein [Casimicrobiaceae bacterium]|nr:ABC transporter ATP-binding protein [Casimicrobiaceae bacterium]
MTDSSVNAIEARGMTRRFGDFVAVANVDFSVRRGEVFGLIGANGAGKTTAIRMLCGTLTPTSGSIAVAGIDVVRRAREARRHIGYVAQRFALYGDLTVRENLTLQAGLYDLPNARARERIAWALRRFDLEGSASTRAALVPLGYQRRLAVAAALLHEPEVLFLDEPTSGLDALARSELWEVVYELAEHDAGVLITTHYMDEAQFCDRLALMHAGAILAEGTPRDLLERGRATPVLEVEANDSARCLALLRAEPNVIEVLPHAGRLRATLREGSSADTVVASIRRMAMRESIGVATAESVPADLEDIVVAMLEQRDASP